MNFGDGNYVYMSTPPYLRRMAALVKERGVKPELEVFDLGPSGWRASSSRKG
jgi:uncharacterized protein (DUF849 family)